MAEGTKEDYEWSCQLYAAETKKNITNRVLQLLQHLKGDQFKFGAKIDLYEHSLQTATRALRDGADEETIVCALLHDMGELLSPSNHGEIPAAILKPYISPENYWLLSHHEIFQGYYYLHHIGGNRNVRDIYRNNPNYNRMVYFCEKFDQASFDPVFVSEPLHVFEPMVQRIFSRKPYWWDPSHPKLGCVTGNQ